MKVKNKITMKIDGNGKGNKMFKRVVTQYFDWETCKEETILETALSCRIIFKLVLKK